MAHKPANKQARKRASQRRTRTGQFARKRTRGETISETVMPPEVAGPATEAPRDAVRYATHAHAEYNDGEVPQTVYRSYTPPKLARPWYRRFWAWLTA